MNNFFVKLIKNPYVLNLLLAVVVTCGLIYGALKWLDHYTRHNEAVVVPDVKGLKIEEAAEFFKNNNLRYNVIDSVFSKDVEPGAIVELSPLAGSKVKEGRIVFITVNALTSQMATIPEVEDLSFRQAYALLKARGFEMWRSSMFRVTSRIWQFLSICVDGRWQKVSMFRLRHRWC